MKQRLHKIIAESTELSRRAAEREIAAGRISVNGNIVSKMGFLADPDADVIRWRGKVFSPRKSKIYLIYNKPRGKLVTKKDSLGRPTIWSDLKGFRDKVNSVGRLDYNSEGLLILTNDGEFINRLTHPRHHVRKIYRVKVKGIPRPDELNRLRKGAGFEGVSYRPAGVRLVSQTENNSWLEVEISEGKYRQVRKMFESIGHGIMRLRRVAVGEVRLGRLEPSEWRFLVRGEIDALRKEMGVRA